MKRNVWIWNHYATDTFYNKGGRHYWFAENLIKSGYKPTIFCANTQHNSDKIIKISKDKYITKTIENIPYVFVKTVAYKGNGFQRIKNMIAFYRNLFPVAKEYAKNYGKPDVILASSVHPLTLVAGIKIAKKFGVPCVCEVRDLWPESLVAYGVLKRNSLMAKILYRGEKWIYKKADKLIFTMEGGKDYIIERGWDKESGGPVDLDKVHHINNGVDLEVFNYNKNTYVLQDEDLDNPDTFKVIYTGSIRKVNKLSLLIETAKLIKDSRIKFLIWGDGNERELLQSRCREEGVKNIIFKGYVNKKYIPNILSKADVNLLHGGYTSIMRYGMSANKLFDYIAAKKPILSDLKTNYDLILKYHLGIVTDSQEPNDIKEALEKLCSLSIEQREFFKKNLITASNEYDFKTLTIKLANIIETVV